MTQIYCASASRHCRSHPSALQLRTKLCVGASCSLQVGFAEQRTLIRLACALVNLEGHAKFLLQRSGGRHAEGFTLGRKASVWMSIILTKMMRAQHLTTTNPGAWRGHIVVPTVSGRCDILWTIRGSTAVRMAFVGIGHTKARSAASTWPICTAHLPAAHEAPADENSLAGY
eukprot:IDg4492t1